MRERIATVVSNKKDIKEVFDLSLQQESKTITVENKITKEILSLSIYEVNETDLAKLFKSVITYLLSLDADELRGAELIDQTPDNENELDNIEILIFQQFRNLFFDEIKLIARNILSQKRELGNLD